LEEDMSVMQEVDAARVPKEQLVALEKFASTLDPSELRDLLFTLSSSVKSGSDVTLLESDAEVTPAQAAAQLKMSRTHLYKLLDRGEIVSHNVGRDRRVRVADLARFEASRQRDRRELAERFAHQEKTRRGAMDELIADL
jgi:excisionase family DNA binding protein